MSYTDDPHGPFTSAGDGFQKFQRGVSPTIPFAVLDDSLTIFPGDTLGIIKDGNTDVFFGVTDTVNPRHLRAGDCDWVFDIAGASDLGLSIDMGAMGDFEFGRQLRLPVLHRRRPAGAGILDRADEATSQTYTLEGGAIITLDDPLVADGTVLSNDLQTISTPLTGTGSQLTLTLTVEAQRRQRGLRLPEPRHRRWRR